MAINLEELGISKADLQQRVIDQLCEILLGDKYLNEDNAECADHFREELNKHIRTRIDKVIYELAEKYVLPNINKQIENVVIQETNNWGEKKDSKAVGFTEYMVHRIDAYLKEDVDRDGKSKGDANGYSWHKETNRITHCVGKHLQSTIDRAMISSVKEINDSINGGLENAVKDALNRIKVTVSTKS